MKQPKAAPPKTIRTKAQTIPFVRGTGVAVQACRVVLNRLPALGTAAPRPPGNPTRDPL
jgi:hypothetical protein